MCALDGINVPNIACMQITPSHLSNLIASPLPFKENILSYTWCGAQPQSRSIHSLGGQLRVVVVEVPGPRSWAGHELGWLLDAHVVHKLCVPCCSCST